MIYYKRNQGSKADNRRNRDDKISDKEVMEMYIYDELNELDESLTEYGVSCLSYVALNCAR